MKKVLVIASTASMIKQFNIQNIELLKSIGYDVEVAANFEYGNSCSTEQVEWFKEFLSANSVKFHQIEFARKFFDFFGHLRAYKAVKTLIKTNGYAGIHCHAPICGVITRLANNGKVKCIYSPHGFNFYKGSSKLSWLLFYNIECLMSKKTDVIISINKEDYALASKKMKAKNSVFIPGVGVQTDKYDKSIDREAFRNTLGIPKNAVWLLSVGELIKRKNHEILLEALVSRPNMYLTIAGIGELSEHLTEKICKLGLQNRVKLLGFRSDIPDLCKAADIFVFPSFCEGLPVAIMEAMAASMPVVCSRIRGNTDLIDEGKGGFFFEPNSLKTLNLALDKISTVDYESFGSYNSEKIKDFTIEIVMKKTKEVYENCFGEA